MGLKYLERHWLLPPGRYLVGRTHDSELFINDPSVSRRHALITIRDNRLFIDDLQSRNGVYINGEQVLGTTEAKDGDEVTLGDHNLTVVIERAGGWAPESRTETAPISRRAVIAMLPRSQQQSPSPLSLKHEERAFFRQKPKISSRPPHSAIAFEEETDTHRLGGPSADAERSDDRLNTLYLVAAVADKALARGQPRVAEESLQIVLDETLEAARASKEVSRMVADASARYALRLASALRSGRWIDYVFELYLTLGRPLPTREGELLNEAAHKVHTVDVTLLERYLEHVEQSGGPMSTAEREAHRWLSLKFKH